MSSKLCLSGQAEAVGVVCRFIDYCKAHPAGADVIQSDNAEWLKTFVAKFCEDKTYAFFLRLVLNAGEWNATKEAT